jgi:hypothetical protein
MLHLAPHQCFFPHLCLSPPSTLPPIQPPFALVSSVREGGKISLKKKKNKSSLSMEVTLSSHSTQVSKSNHPIFPASTPAIFSLAVNTVHSSFCLLTFYTRVRPTKKKLSLCQPERQLFFLLYIFLFTFLDVSPLSRLWIDCFPFRKPIEKKEFLNPSCRRHSISGFFSSRMFA